MSDAATSNISLVKQISVRRPKNCIVLSVLCCAHQVHLCSAPLWVGLGFLSDMFCTTNVLQTAPQSGNVWLDLQSAAQIIIEERFKVVYTTPHPSHQRFSRSIVNNTLLAGDSTDERDRKSTYELAERLLGILNGNWRSSGPILHHCHFGC